MYINKDTNEYPVNEAQIRALYPSTTFARPFNPGEPFAWVFPTPLPEYDPITQDVREIAPVLTALGTYEQSWEVYALSTEQAQDNLDAAVEHARTVALTRINDAYSERTRVLSTGYPPEERESWPVQVQESQIILSGDTETATPWVDSAAAAREITREAMANLIAAQDSAYRTYHGALSGIRQRLRDEINAVPGDVASDIDVLNDINWPE